MSKPIEFKTYTIKSAFGGPTTVSACYDGTILLSMGDAGNYFNDPSKLRELAAKINEAADALEKSQRLTFGDLQTGECFKFVDYWGQNDRPFIKINEAREYVQVSPFSAHSSYVRGHVGRNVDPLVVRLTATFTEVK